jgi:hypothetical protein
MGYTPQFHKLKCHRDNRRKLLDTLIIELSMTPHGQSDVTLYASLLLKAVLNHEPILGSGLITNN